MKRYYYERGEESGIEKGISQGEKQNMLRCIRSIMKELNVDANKAMNILRVPVNEHEHYLSLI